MSSTTPIEALRASLEQLCTILQGVETRLATVERHQQDLIRKSDELLSHKIAIPPPRDVPRDEALPKVSPPPAAPTPKKEEEKEKKKEEEEEGEEPEEGERDSEGEEREPAKKAKELPFNHSTLLTGYEPKFEKTAKPELFEHDECLYLKVWSHEEKCHMAYYPAVKGDLITAIDFTRQPIGVVNEDDELEPLPAPKPASKAQPAPKTPAKPAGSGVAKK